MALPTLVKTWEHDVNNVGGVSSTAEEDAARTMYAVKSALIGDGDIATAPWTVVSSSDGSTAGAGDNWGGQADIRGGGGAHSWIVLADPTGDYEICIDMANVSEYICTFVWSPGGNFTGGTASARPTASDEVVILNNTTWLGSSAAHTSKVHVQVSADGEATIVTAWVAGVCAVLWVLCELQDTPAGMTDATFLHISTLGTGQQGARTGFVNNQLRNAMVPDGTTTINPHLSCEAIWVNTAGEDMFYQDRDHANDFSSEWELGPVGVWGRTGTQRGKLGNIPDLFWNIDTVNVGDQYPASGTLYQFASIGDLTIPWDSTTVIQTS